MTDRLKGFVVVLDKDLRDDDAEPILAAIRLLRGVISVKPVLGGDQFEEERVRHELRRKLFEALK